MQTARDRWILRQMGKERLTLLHGGARMAAGVRRAIIVCAAVLAALVPLPTAAISTSLGTAYAIDPLTGAALDGYDAVSYFAEPTPLPGRPEFEYYWAGVPWYFASAGNRDAFAGSPETYAPMFGGYATMSVARGYLSVGNPRIFVVLAGRLFLFYSSGNKEAFLLSPRDAYQKAESNWMVLSNDLGF